MIVKINVILFVCVQCIIVWTFRYKQTYIHKQIYFK
jgi:hypothetical protein